MSQTLWDYAKGQRMGYRLPETGLDETDVLNDIDSALLREKSPKLPSLSEPMVVRHFTRLSHHNYGVDQGMYPLGSCTMKYNPKINDQLASLAGFSQLHPDFPVEGVQGALGLMHHLQEQLKVITGMDAVALSPAAGSHGELTGLMMMKAYLKDKGLQHKQYILIPDSAHGTNPASVTMAGFKTREIPSNNAGTIDLEHLDRLLDQDVAGLMLTNPNTLGLFEKDIKVITKKVHDVGGLLYYDGANMNANMGITNPGLMGFDIVHLNLHKTFSTPHGGGGPGAGPVGVKAHLAEYLPAPIVVHAPHEEVSYNWYTPQKTIGHVKAYYGNFGILVRAYIYILTMGGDGLKEASRLAVLNANYMLARLKDHYNAPYSDFCKHEFVLAGLKVQSGGLGGIRTFDVAKRLIDLGVHPPTIYFPLIVQEALMIEPTETESKADLDHYCDCLIQIAREAFESPEILKAAPITTPVGRMDEVAAARKPVVRHSIDN